VPRIYYGFGRRDVYRYEQRPTVRYRPTPSDPPSQPSETKPPTPKWIHVGKLDIDMPSLGEGVPSEGQQRLTNCLTVRTEITIDGQSMDAFGKACIQADGSWRLVPAEPVGN
jgi:hypothetical protein